MCPVFFTILFFRLCEFVIINVSNLTCSVGPLEYALVTLPLRQSEPHANLARSHLSCHHEPDNQPWSWPSSFGNTCNRQRAPLAATTGPLRNNSEQTNWRDENSICFPIDPAPGQGPGLHCCFCIACKNISDEVSSSIWYVMSWFIWCPWQS